MGFFSSQMAQYMQVLISVRHAVIRSMCEQLAFVSVSNDMCCRVATVHRLDGTFMASQSIL